jgi:hypothetical protein
LASPTLTLTLIPLLGKLLGPRARAHTFVKGTLDYELK